MEKINVLLYGGKNIFVKGETPLNADIIYCDNFKECSYYKNNMCLKHRGSTSNGYCEFGERVNVKGYTSRAKKYHSFKSKYQNDESYNKLKDANKRLGEIGEYIVFPYNHIVFSKENNKIVLNDPCTCKIKKDFFILKKDFTVDFIKELCDFKPQALFGGEVSSYQKKEIPLFLSHLKELLPDLYKDFITKYKEYDTEINYIGRKALLHTTNPSNIYNKSSSYPELNSEWYWDGEFLIYKNGYVSSVDVINNYEIEEFKLKPNEKATTIIYDNSQINENTIFID